MRSTASFAAPDSPGNFYVSTKEVLDLTNLQFIDSTGISVLIAEHKRTASAGGELIILTPHRNARRVFEVAGLMDVLHILPHGSSSEGAGR